MRIRLCKSGPTEAAAPIEAVQFGVVPHIAGERWFEEE
jgi:hypothetical protein